MRIRSKFRDYYDFVGHRYGQDPLCTYQRGKISGEEVVGADRFGRQVVGRRLLGPVRPFDSTFRARSDSFEYSETPALLRWIVVGRRCFPVVLGRTITGTGSYDASIWNWVRPFDERIDAEFRTVRISKDWPKRRQEEVAKQNELDLPVVYPKEEEVLECVRSVGAPVFMVEGFDDFEPGRANTSFPATIHVYENVPVLVDCGIPSLLPPEQAWQLVYEALTSILRKDPDKEPPRTVSNEERIIAAGFDKRSFRHPTKLKDL